MHKDCDCTKGQSLLRVPQSRASLNLLVEGVQKKEICTSFCMAPLSGHLGGPGRPLVASLVHMDPPCIPVVGGASRAKIISLSPVWNSFPIPSLS